MKFSFKKLPPLPQNSFIPPECACSGASCENGPPTCYTDSFVPGGGPWQPPGFDPKFDPGNYCGDDCAGCMMSNGPVFSDGEIYSGGPFDSNMDFDPVADICPGEEMYLSGPLPCKVVDDQNNPITVEPRSFAASLDYYTLSRYYQLYHGAYPINAYSSLPENEGSALRVAKLDYTIDHGNRMRNRSIVLSAFNRYRYVGPLAVNCTPAQRWHNQAPDAPNNWGDFVGLSGGFAPGEEESTYVNLWRSDPDILAKKRTVPLYGIIKLEESVHGEYPHPDSKMNLPLFGGTSISQEKEPPKDCCPVGTPCFSLRECAKCMLPDDEDLASGNGTPMGYFQHPFRNHSARPYNPDCHLGPGRTTNVGGSVQFFDSFGAAGERVQAPHCSLYSLFWAIRNYVFVYANQFLQDAYRLAGLPGYPPFPVKGDFLNWNAAVDPDNPDNANGAIGNEGSPWWYNIDPGGYQTDGINNNQTMNPIYVMERLQDAMPGYVASAPSNFPEYAHTLLRFKIPRILLWDHENYKAATSNKDKWKHIYIPGSINVLYDTGCVTSNGPLSAGLKRRGFLVDNTSCRHNAKGDPKDSLRILYFPFCNCPWQPVTFPIPLPFLTDGCDFCGGGYDGNGLHVPQALRSHHICLQPCNADPCGANSFRYWFGGFSGNDYNTNPAARDVCWTNSIGLDYWDRQWNDSEIDYGYPCGT